MVVAVLVQLNENLNFDDNSFGSNPYSCHVLRETKKSKNWVNDN